MKEHDLVLWGATGFTGRLVVAYLARHAPPGLRWALGGRDRARLEQLRADLGVPVEIVTGDALDRPSMDTVVRTARVVVSTVGPYARFGTPLVEACVAQGASYCDLTGEPQWIRANIDRFHARAAETGARIVHCCGFDSIPSDLGVWMLHDHLRRTHGRRLASARFYVTKIRGSFSGGTAASMMNVLEEAGRDREVRRLLVDPYSLNPEGERSGQDGKDRTGARFEDDLGRWTAPFLMAAINTRVVRRSNALMGWPYGRDFRYDEAMAAPGPLRAHAIAAGMNAFALGASTRPVRALMRRFLPAPGEGPSAEERQRGSFEATLPGRSDGDPSVEVRGVVRGGQDPGYGETSKMLAESALCLALDDLPPRGGILTPASCFGVKLLERLRAAGMIFEVRDASLKPPPGNSRSSRV